MDCVEALHRLGGVARRGALIAATSRSDVDRALGAGMIVSVGRGGYSLPGATNAERAAAELSGVLCLTSAALHHGWEVKAVPTLPQVVVGRGRRISRGRSAAVELHRRDLHISETDGLATSKTSKLTTLEMCMRSLPFDEALAIADSYLRHGGTRSELRGIALAASGPGAPRMRRVAKEARAEPANPFESVLRAIALDVDGLHVEPQVVIDSPVVWARPDLVDEDLRLVLEADSFGWHGDRAALHRDANRYNLLVAAGWQVLRFSWEQVMFHPDEVARILALVVRRHTELDRADQCAA